MKHRFFGLVLRAAIVVVAVYTVGPRVAGQEAQRATPGAPIAATPRMADGHPDLSGYWYRRLPPITPVRRVGGSIILDRNAPRDPNEPPSGNAPELLLGTPTYKPEFLAKVKELDENQVFQIRRSPAGLPGSRGLGPRSALCRPPARWWCSTMT